MNKKILWYSLGFNIATSFLGALAYKYFCDAGTFFCGDIAAENHLDIFIPTVISGTIFIAIAFFIGYWLKKVWWLFFVITAILAVAFNGGGGETFDLQYALVLGLPSIMAVVAGWYFGKGKRVENTPSAPSTPPQV